MSVREILLQRRISARLAAPTRTVVSRINIDANGHEETFMLLASSDMLPAGFTCGRGAMNWDAAGAIGEIFGAIAVLITLLYLAAQVRQTNKMASFETTREIMAQFNDLNRLYATDSAIRQVLLKEGELSVEEDEQLYTYTDMYCNAWATTQIAFKQGQIDEALFDGVVQDVGIALNRWPRMRHQIKRWLHNYPAFKANEIFEAVNQS